MPKDPSFDWSQFSVGIYIKARPDDLFRLWTVPDALCSWFLRSAAFASSEGPPEAGSKVEIPQFDDLPAREASEPCAAKDRYRWEWYYDGGVIGEEWIRELRAPTRLVFGFGDRMEVEVAIRKKGSLSEVHLRQYNIPTGPRARRELHVGCRIGWTFFLTNLKSVAEGGLDLRETDMTRSRQLHLVNI